MCGQRGKVAEFGGSLAFQLSNHADANAVFSKGKRSGLGVEIQWRISMGLQAGHLPVFSSLGQGFWGVWGRLAS